MHFDVELRTIHMMKVIEEEGSMAKAATALYISQPALSSYIKRIENQLSFQLYKREKGRCYLTDAGKVLLTEGKLLLKQYDTIMHKLEVAGHNSNQGISLGWPMCYTVQYLHKIKSDFSSSFPMKINIKEDSVENLIQQLLDKKLNLLLIPAYYSHPELEYKTLRREEFYLAVPKNHESNSIINEHSVYADLSKLSEMPFISLYSEAYEEFVKSLFDEAGYSPNIIFMCNSWDSSHSLVEKGLGLSIVPYWFAEKENDKVNYFKIKSHCQTYRTFAFVYLRNQPIEDNIQQFIDSAIKHFGDKFAQKPFEDFILNRKL